MAKNRRYMMDEDFDEKDRIDDNDINAVTEALP